MTARAAGLPTRSLRLRVGVGALGLLVVVLLGLGILVNTLLRTTLRSDLQSRLEDRALYAALLQEQGVTGQTLADKLTGANVQATFTTPQGSYTGRPTEPPTAPGRPGGPPPKPAVAPSITYAEQDGQLTASVTFSNGTLRLAASESDIDRTLAELERIELAAGGAGLLVAALLLAVVVHRAMRPLSRMTALARRIRDGARGGRLRPRSPNTDLGRTAAAFDEMLDALEAAENAAQQSELRMRAFLADASHDLRTPLAGVIAGAEQLLRHPGSRLDREAQLVAVVRQARRAGRLVDDLLLMTRLDGADESALLSVRPLDLDLLVGAEIDAARSRAPQVPIAFSTPDGPVRVIGDPDRLQRTLANLLDNAAQSGASLVRVILAEDREGARVCVTDDGRGVPDAERERVFDRFVRLDAARTGPGTGLGLPISRAIARAHGGDLRCLPADAGACFELRLPADHQIRTRSPGSSHSASVSLTSNAV